MGHGGGRRWWSARGRGGMEGGEGGGGGGGEEEQGGEQGREGGKGGAEQPMDCPTCRGSAPRTGLVAGRGVGSVGGKREEPARLVPEKPCEKPQLSVPESESCSNPIFANSMLLNYPFLYQEMDEKYYRHVSWNRLARISIFSRELARWICIRCSKSYASSPFERIFSSNKSGRIPTREGQKIRMRDLPICCPKCRWTSGYDPLEPVLGQEQTEPNTPAPNLHKVSCRSKRVPGRSNPSFFSRRSYPRWVDDAVN